MLRRVHGDGPRYHPLHPLQGFRGPLRCTWDLAVVDPGMAVGPRITHPVYPPGIPHPGTPRSRTPLHADNFTLGPVTTDMHI